MKKTRRFYPLSAVAEYFGYSTGNSMLKAFSRGQLPKECLIQISPRVLRVDKAHLEKWFLEKGIQRTQL